MHAAGAGLERMLGGAGLGPLRLQQLFEIHAICEKKENKIQQI